MVDPVESLFLLLLSTALSSHMFTGVESMTAPIKSCVLDMLVYRLVYGA